MLNDKQRKKVIADYIETQNYRETARRNNISDKTVKEVVDKEPDTTQKLAEKKRLNSEIKN